MQKLIRLSLILFCVASPHGFGDERATVRSFSPHLPLESKDPQLQIVNVPGRSVATGNLIPIAVREEVFTESGLAEQVEAMDELDRDILIMDLAGKSLSEVKKKFKSLNPASLKRAQKSLKEKGWRVER